MPEFSAVKHYLETHEEQLAASVANRDAFQRELANLRRDWQEDEDDAYCLEITLEAMRKYPTVWQALADAGLTPANPPAQPAPPTSVAAPFPQESTMSEPPPTQPPTYDPTARNHQLTIGKEIVTGCLGILIVTTMLFLAAIAVLAVLAGVVDEKAWSAAKDILLILSGLVGVVLGYYFGRVPGELRADQAEGEAKEARSELDRTVAEVRGILADVDIATTRGEAGATLSTGQMQRLRAILDRPRP